MNQLGLECADGLVPQRRLVLLGASNLTRCLATIVETARQQAGVPLDVLAAMGHGRSYGMASRVLVRHLPSIVDCQLWPELDRRGPLPTAALITDVGNDLLYGATVDQIAGWVQQCLERLAPRTQQIVITQLPLESVSRLSAWRYLLLRSMLFPGTRLTLQQALQRAGQLNERLIALARRYDVPTIAPPAEWYKLDTIHIRRACRQRAWQTICACWHKQSPPHAVDLPLRSRLRLLRLRPHYRRCFGIEQHQCQPTACLSDGTRISWY